MTYARVIPRDLFNEANLLKCLGKLALWEVDHPTEAFRVRHVAGPFDVQQDASDGSIYCANIHIVIGEQLFDHFRPLNARGLWPLWLRPAFNREAEFEAFDGVGNLSAELKALIEQAEVKAAGE